MRQFILFILTMLAYTSIQASNLPVIGWIEPVMILSDNFTLDAKIDTGADNSSIDASDIEYFSKNAKKWIKFKVVNNKGAALTMKYPVESFAQIKRKQGGVIERPVVKLTLCIGQQKYTAPVNISNRKHFQYRMLIGRSFLENGFLVDSSTTRTSKPVCHLNTAK